VTSEIRDRVDRVRDRIAAAARRSGREPEAVTLIAVSKTMSAETVREAVAAGLRMFGENRVQEAREKIAACPGLAAWHLIGHLQTNKARLAVELFDCIHSLDSLKLAEELQRHAQSLGKRMRCLVQVNIGDETQKSGAAAVALRDLLGQARAFPNLQLDGLMAIPPFLDDPEAVRPYFRRLRELRDALAGDGLSGADLSMGMTGDFEVAIEEGATLVRIGTAIFGARGYGQGQG
jgi:pyridoxal phosphate enzyme (YggS family)